MYTKITEIFSGRKRSLLGWFAIVMETRPLFRTFVMTDFIILWYSTTLRKTVDIYLGRPK